MIQNFKNIWLEAGKGHWWRSGGGKRGCSIAIPS